MQRTRLRCALIMAAIAASVLGAASCRLSPGRSDTKDERLSSVRSTPAEPLSFEVVETPVEDEEWLRAIRAKLAEPISFDFVEAPLDDVVAFLRVMKRVNIVRDSGIARARKNAAVTLKVENAKFGDALTQVCSQCDLVWTATNEAICITTVDGLRDLEKHGLNARDRVESAMNTVISIKSTNVPFGTLVDHFQERLGVRMLFDDLVPPRAKNTAVTLTLNRVSFAEALRLACQQAGLEYLALDDALFISTPEGVKQRKDLQQALSGPESDPEWEKVLHTPLVERTSFDFISTPLEDVLAFLRVMKKVNIVLDKQAPAGKALADLDVTLKVDNMQFRNAMGWVMRTVGLQYSVVDGAILVSTEQGLRECDLTPPLVYDPATWKTLERQLEQRVSLEFISTPLADAVAFLEKTGDVRIKLDDRNLAGHDTSLQLKNVPLKHALAWICRLHGMTYRIENAAIHISRRALPD